jgi:crotonobetainyl-CoA:carnitine CoA-transferase CaiB-like acyl-CoA transferase
MRVLAGAGVPCAATVDTAELYDDPHLNARGFVRTVDHPELGRVRMLGFAPRLSGSEVDFANPPKLGEHTDAVLAAELGLDAERLRALRAAETIA